MGLQEVMGGGTETCARLTLDGVEEAERYEVWRQSIGCIFDVAPRPSETPFFAEVEAHIMGPLFLARTRTTAQLWERSALTLARDGMDHFMIQLYESGTQQVSWSGGTIDMPENGLLIYDLSRETRAESTDFSNLSLILPRQMIEGLLHDPHDQHMRALDGGEPLVALLREHMRALAGAAGAMTQGQGRALAPLTADLVVACLNETDGDARPRQPMPPPVLLAQLRRTIERDLGNPELTPAELCRRHDISRTRLYDLFAAFGGVSAYILERRLRSAMLALTAPGPRPASVSAVAAGLAFSSTSNFSRAFQRRYGMSPRAARHYGRISTGEPRHAAVDRRYEFWLRELML